MILSFMSSSWTGRALRLSGPSLTVRARTERGQVTTGMAFLPSVERASLVMRFLILEAMKRWIFWSEWLKGTGSEEVQSSAAMSWELKRVSPAMNGKGSAALPPRRGLRISWMQKSLPIWTGPTRKSAGAGFHLGGDLSQSHQQARL